MTILVLEDDPMVRMITVRFLLGVDAQFAIHEAATVAEARDLCRSKAFDLMLVDVYFPNRTGIEFLREERAAGNAAPVIMITADKSPATVELALSLGAVDYLIKPFELPRFQEAIGKAVKRIAWREAAGGRELDQRGFDAMMGSPDRDPAPDEGFIPEKGFGAATYRHLQEVIGETHAEFSASEIADRAGLARVTVRRYLENMVKEGELEMSPVYGQVGRPKHLFRRKR